MAEKINIGVVGSGYWGPNLIRNIAQLPDVALHTVCDLDTNILAKNARLYPNTRTTTDFSVMLNDPAVQGVVLATPAHLHAAMAMQALEAGKHVMVEKPLALTSEDARRLVEKAAANNLRLMVGHVFEYNPAVIMLRDLVRSGELGRVLYAYSTRVNLGKIRDDLNAMWNLAPHDISILNFALDQVPVEVSARGFGFLGRPDLEDVVFMTMGYPNGVAAHIHVSWLDPNKTRRTTLVGDKKMVVYDDMSQDERIRIYDKGVLRDDGTAVGYGEFRLITRSGDVYIPNLPTTEPLRAECAHFVDCIRTGQNPTSDGIDGYRVVRIMEAAQESIQQHGIPVPLNMEL